MYGRKSVIIEFKGANIKNITNQFLERVDRAAQQAMQATAKDLRESLRGAVGTFGNEDEVGWTGYLYNSIEAYNKGQMYPGSGAADEWGVRMLDYGKELDSRPAHYETLTKGRKITTWARAHNIKASRIIVKPHPFINNGLARFPVHIQSALDQHLGE